SGKSRQFGKEAFQALSAILRFESESADLDLARNLAIQVTGQLKSWRRLRSNAIGKFFERVAGRLDWIPVRKARGECPALGSHFQIIQQVVKMFGDRRPTEPAWRQRARDSHSAESTRVFRLFVAHWHRQLGYAGSEGLSRRANSSVRHQRGRPRQS